MEIAGILVNEVAVMFLLIGIGVLGRKTNIINDDSARVMSNMMLMIVMPAVVVRSLQSERNDGMLLSMTITFAVAMLLHIGKIAIANLMFRDTGDGSTAWRVSKISVVFANAGFMGFPLILATIGETGLLYGAMFIGVFNITSWIWCIPALTDSGFPPIKKILLTPSIAAFIISVTMYLLNTTLPGALHSAALSLSGLNMPLAMIIIGAFLASQDLHGALRDKAVYKVIFMRNILYPLATLLFFLAIRISVWLPDGKTLAVAFLIMESCPCAVSSILMPARYGCDSVHGAKLVAASTAASIVTIPLIAMLCDVVL